MIRGTTPTFKMNISDNLNLNKVQQIWVTFKVKDDIRLNFTKDDVTIDATNHVLFFTLSQEDTLKLPVGKVDVQLRILIDDKAYATPIQQISVTGLLKSGVIEEPVIGGDPAPEEPSEPSSEETEPVEGEGEGEETEPEVTPSEPTEEEGGDESDESESTPGDDGTE